MKNTKRFKEMENHFENLIKQHGWASHYVPLDQNHINYHTHGVELTYGHDDFQITIPLDMSAAHSITSRIIEDVKTGKRFEEDKDYYGYLKDGYKIGFKKYMECGRDVLRILICDSNNKLPHEDGCLQDYRYQLDALED